MQTKNRTGSGLDGDGPGGTVRRNVPTPERTTDWVLRSRGDVSVVKLSKNSCKLSEKSNTLAEKRLQYRQFSKKSDKNSS